MQSINSCTSAVLRAQLKTSACSPVSSFQNQDQETENSYSSAGIQRLLVSAIGATSSKHWPIVRFDREHSELHVLFLSTAPLDILVCILNVACLQLHSSTFGAEMKITVSDNSAAFFHPSWDH